MKDELMEKLLDLSRNNPIVNACLEIHACDNIPLEDALATMVLKLAEINKKQHNYLVNYVMTYGTEVMI